MRRQSICRTIRLYPGHLLGATELTPAASTRHPASAIGADVRSVADYLPDWGSVDSAPEGLAVARSAWLAPLILATVGGCLVVSLAWNQPLARAYVQVLDVFGRSTPSDPSPSLGFRPFLGVVIVLLSAAVPGGLGQDPRA